MKRTAKTALSYEECLNRLAACPALPRGERWYATESYRIGGAHFTCWWRMIQASPSLLSYQYPDFADEDAWRRQASTVRRLHEERQCYRNALKHLAQPGRCPNPSECAAEALLGPDPSSL